MKTKSADFVSAFGLIDEVRHGQARILEGMVATEFGYVRVFAERNSTRLSFIWNRRVYDRVIPRGFTEDGLVIEAVKLAREIAE